LSEDKEDKPQDEDKDDKPQDEDKIESELVKGTKITIEDLGLNQETLEKLKKAQSWIAKLALTAYRPVLDPKVLASITRPVLDPKVLASITRPVLDSKILASIPKPVLDPKVLASMTRPVLDPKLIKLMTETQKIQIPRELQTKRILDEIKDLQITPVIIPQIKKVEYEIREKQEETIEYMKTFIENQNKHSDDLEKQLKTLKTIENKSLDKKTAFLISLGASIAGLIIGLVIGFFLPSS